MDGPSLIKGGEKRDKNGHVRETRIGMYDTSSDRYTMSAIQLVKDSSSANYKVRKGKTSFTRSEHPFTLLRKDVFFDDYWLKEFNDDPISTETLENHPTTRNMALSESDKLIYDSLVTSQGLKPDDVMNLLAIKNEFLSEVLDYNIHPVFLNGAVATKVVGHEGQSIIYWSVKGLWERFVAFENGEFIVTSKELGREHPESAARLIRFLERYLPHNVNGKPYDLLQQDLINLKERLVAAAAQTNNPIPDDDLDLIPALMFQ